MVQWLKGREMEIPLQLILFSIPSVIYLIVRKAQHQTWRAIFQSLGWRKPNLRFVIIGFFFGLLPGIFSFVIMDILPSGMFDQPGIAQSAYAGWTPSISAFFLALIREAIYTALGEEVFFRGFLGNLLIRRLRFTLGNLVQSIVFLLPHMLLLTIDLQFWPVLIPQFVAGWFFGWLAFRSGSILPSWVAHGMSNAFAALAFMR